MSTTDCNNSTTGASTGDGAIDTNSHNKKSNSDALFQAIPPRLRIQLIYQDDDIIVVSKPCGLRSVPGNADTAIKSSLDRKRPRSPSPSSSAAAAGQEQQRLTAQQAWTEAIRLLAMTNNKNNTTTTSTSSSDSDNDQWNIYLQRLGANQSRLASIPRKYPTFCRYIRRSHSRLFERDNHTDDDDSRLEALIKQLYCRIEKCQRSLMHLPEPTKDEESVLGQLKLLGLSSSSSSIVLETNSNDNNNYDSRSNQDLFPVHRLDCETSGVMVVARTRNAASVLSRAWREKSKIQNNNNKNNATKNDKNSENNSKKIKVHKVYHALVHDWKPWREHQQRQGQIDLALAPHPTQRIKWVAIHPTNNNNNNNNSDSNSAAAKPSLTHWKVLVDHGATATATASSTSPSKAQTATAATSSTLSTDSSSSNNHHVSPVRLELLPITGRTHQLRIHCAETGGAIIGDALYAAAAADDDVKKKQDDDGDDDNGKSFLHLHAYQLTFPHPKDEEREMKFTVDPAW